MFSVFERLISSVSKPHTQPKPQLEPEKCIYEERIECFQNLIELQKNIKSTDEEYFKSLQKIIELQKNNKIEYEAYLYDPSIEGKQHEIAWKRLEAYTAECTKEYKRCKKLMEY